MGKEYESEDNDPEVIRAKADAEVRKLEARAKLHPASQFVYTTLDAVGNIIAGVGCLIIIGIVVLAIFAQPISKLLGR